MPAATTTPQIAEGWWPAPCPPCVDPKRGLDSGPLASRRAILHHRHGGPTDLSISDRLSAGFAAIEAFVAGSCAMLVTIPFGKWLRRRQEKGWADRQRAHYHAWIELVETPSRPSVETMRETIAGFAFQPTISILTPVFNTDRRWIEAAVASVQAQAYPHWELCLCDDHSSAPHIGPLLDAFEASDPRIKTHRRSENGHISAATNDALSLATGEYVSLMDHDDVIAENALFEFVRVLNEDRSVDFIYSDEDKMSLDGERYEPFFKPGWSPEYLESCMYTAHLALYRTDLARRLGGFRKECDGAQDYDFVLRYTEHVANVRHVPKILYHWRAIPGSTALSMDSKDYVLDAALRALSQRATRTGALEFARNSAYPGCFELRRKLVGRPLVSIVIPSAGRDARIGRRRVDLLANCLASIRSETAYDNIEIIVVDNGDLRATTRAALQEASATAVTYDGAAFNVAVKMNLGARHANGDVLVFLNDDIEILSPDWLDAMLALLQRPGVGVVGAKLLFEDGDLQHVGVAFCRGLPDHIRRGYPQTDAGYGFSSVANRNYLAVTGACLMITRADFEAVAGFNEAFAVNYNDIDLCLKVIGLGKRVVYSPQAVLRHFESRSRTRTVSLDEIGRFFNDWGDVTLHDPYYSRWLHAQPPLFELADPRLQIGTRPA